MQAQTRLFELWLGTMSDLAKIALEQGARLQSRQLELVMAMQIRLAESQAGRVMDFWERYWRAAIRPAAPAARGGPSPT